METSVGTTTTSASLSDQVKRYRLRTLTASGGGSKRMPNATDNSRISSLYDMCVDATVQNFATRPVAEPIPAEHMREIVARLPVELDPRITAVSVFDENYWKRCCIERFGWHHCHLVEHGLTWKRLFFETYAQECLESLQADEGKEDEGKGGEGKGSEDPLDEVLELLKVCQDYIFTLTVKQLPSHPDMERVLALLPNLSKLELSYGVGKCGMNYERMMFGMKISDANHLSRALMVTPNLTTLVLQGNLIDDDLLRMLTTGLINNESITHLDMSHNKITNHGIRLLAKLMGKDSVLTCLNLADNQLHAESGRYLGHGLRTNDSLVDLNLRLNRLTDVGGHLLLQGLAANDTLERLNLSANDLASDTCSALAAVLNSDRGQSTPPLSSVDLSCNRLGSDDVVVLKNALLNNSTLTNLDLRMNPDIGEDAKKIIDEINDATHKNELAVRF